MMVACCILCAISLCVGCAQKGKALNALNAEIEDNIVVGKSGQTSGPLIFKSKSSSIKDAIPDAATATKVSLILLANSYGEKVYDEHPFVVSLIDSVWVVETSHYIELPIHYEEDGRDTTIVIGGGVGHVEIGKNDGKVYAIYYTK